MKLRSTSCALQEWNAIPQDNRLLFSDAVESLRVQIDHENHVLAVHNFCYFLQESSESIIHL